jgi:hypothetical protein
MIIIALHIFLNNLKPIAVVKLITHPNKYNKPSGLCKLDDRPNPQPITAQIEITIIMLQNIFRLRIQTPNKSIFKF